jgi:hypothetical protein|tara:strand:+ start:223 stop:411 length:189 start_codon:yes stop_codon:yes gene_type:complete
MAKVKSLYMDLQEDFYGKAAVLVKDSDTVEEAQNRVEKLRKVEYNFLNESAIAQEVEEFWYA